jgi:hypothetical protein
LSFVAFITFGFLARYKPVWVNIVFIRPFIAERQEPRHNMSNEDDEEEGDEQVGTHFF